MGIQQPAGRDFFRFKLPLLQDKQHSLQLSDITFSRGQQSFVDIN